MGDTPSFPRGCESVGRRIEYLSTVLLPAGRFDEYAALIGTLFHDRVHYIDPVHELTHREAVVAMLRKYLPRVRNDAFRFELVVDGATEVIWRWTIGLKIRFTPWRFLINGLVHARVKDGKIVYQREYYDPMESIGVIPGVGWLYKLVLKLG